MSMSEAGSRLFGKLFGTSVLALFFSGVYLYIFPSATVAYAGIVLVHTFVGLFAAVSLAPVLWRHFREWKPAARFGWILFAAGAVLGMILIYTGTPRSAWNWLYAHILLSAIACA